MCCSEETVTRLQQPRSSALCGLWRCTSSSLQPSISSGLTVSSFQDDVASYIIGRQQDIECWRHCASACLALGYQVSRLKLCNLSAEAVPKRILDIMNVDNLTRENVASPLQVSTQNATVHFSAFGRAALVCHASDDATGPNRPKHELCCKRFGAAEIPLVPQAHVWAPSGGQWQEGRWQGRQPAVRCQLPGTAPLARLSASSTCWRRLCGLALPHVGCIERGVI